jgi:hypothetical protein
MDLLYSFVLAVFGFAIGFIGGKMSKDILGIHHVTAGTSNPQRKIDFHIRILGL